MPRPATTGAPLRARGQATVELALALPVVAVLLLAVAQVLVVAHGRLAVEHAAREAARAAAVDPDPAAATRAALASGLPAAGTTVEVRAVGDGLVEVTVRRRLATDVPLVGPLTPEVALVGQATFRREQPAASAASVPPERRPP